MSDGQTEACEANAPGIDWSKPVEYLNDYGRWLPAETLWQDSMFIVMRSRGTSPWVLRKLSDERSRYRNAPSPPQYRPFLDKELPDLVGRRFRDKEDGSTNLAISVYNGRIRIDAFRCDAVTLLKCHELDDNGQWVPAGVRL